MKLAEALLIRSDMQKKLAQIKGRIRSNVKVQEGDA
ncbi:MAG TPA: septicolysin, partial [Psychrobacter sp.]|nr:septicolysin [Psychrobacter sp.]